MLPTVDYVNLIYLTYNQNYPYTLISNKIPKYLKVIKTNLHTTTSTPNSVMGAKKLSSSPKFQRHLSYVDNNKSNNNNINTHSINQAFIAKLPFSGSANSSTGAGSYQSTTNNMTYAPNTLSSVLSFKQIYMTASNCKLYDRINNIINQQIHFCAQYLVGTNSTIISSNLIDLTSSPSPLTNSNSNFSGINR